MKPATARKVPAAERTQSLPAPCLLRADGLPLPLTQAPDAGSADAKRRCRSGSSRKRARLVAARAGDGGLPRAHFRQPEGVVTRYVQDRLEILFWLRPPQAPGDDLRLPPDHSRRARRCLAGSADAARANRRSRARVARRKGAARRDPTAGRHSPRLEAAIRRFGNRRGAAALGSGALPAAAGAVAGKRAARPAQPDAAHRRRAQWRSPSAAGRSLRMRAVSSRSRKRRRTSSRTCRTN